MTYFKTIIPVLALTVLLGTGSIAGAQGTTTPDTTTTQTTPTAPNTGAGGDAPFNLAVLGVSGIVALFGASYLIANRTRKH